ncbi:DUF2142 domain-containing protein [Demequina sp. SYSU T00039]|uniref:DUF2142 domain-containing protein n=1 Tax=Demequina lignilytica TaxID=3051663 RepID=A0AAW7M8G8_9MICO|nr:MULTISPECIES: DUF2142 domain-containing protein [unclassified Demequina]MDN4477881.1 DUF2142 domain-containing protein [Demequina sp. SYSU T00039-1]MDN4487790.1 DUF2142 domain-containing protein [Demequina sp. SYSU T00039]MDN4490827.1 DUF2142 domain-containing protein [Demequina sp. SYSU T00068]
MSAVETRARERRTWRLGLASVTLLVLLVGAAWSLMAEPFTKVDEPRHFNSVVRLMEGGGWPAPREAPLLDAVRVAASEAGHPFAGDEASPALPGERSALDEHEGSTRGIADDPDWMTQHPPGYYGLTAGLISAVGGHGWSWDHALLAMRLLSDLWVALATIPVALAARRLSGSPRGALVGAAAVLAIPQYFHVGALVSNDALSVLLASLVLHQCVVAMDSERGSWRRAAVLGLTLGAGLFVKGLFLTLIPVVAIALAVPAVRRHGWRWRALIAPAIAMAVAFATGGWWYLRNLLVYGAIQPSNFGSGREDVAAEGYDLLEFVTTALLRLNSTFWGSLNPALALPGWYLAGALVVTLLVVVVGAIRSRHRLILLVLAAYPVALLAITLNHAWEIYWNYGLFRGIQGRYLFPAILILGVLVAISWSVVERRLRAPLPAIGGAVAVLGLGAVACAGWMVALHGFWPEAGSVGEGLAVMSAALGVPGVVANVLVVAAFAALALTAAAVAVQRGTDDDARTVPVAPALAPS